MLPIDFQSRLFHDGVLGSGASLWMGLALILVLAAHHRRRILHGKSVAYLDDSQAEAQKSIDEILTKHQCYCCYPELVLLELQ